MIAQILIVYGSFTTGTKTFFSGGQFRPDRGGQFGPDRGGQFGPVKGGQFKPDRGGQLHRIFQYINILDLCETGTRELGPGNRYVIWVQGCPFNCSGCITPEGIPIAENNMVEINQIISAICEHEKISGITISGGEPFMQASKLVKILKAVKTIRPELDVVVFTGFKLKELDWTEALELLQIIDVLIDGKYIERLNDNKGLRGSSNQQVNYLSDRLKEHKYYFEERERSIEVHVYNHQQTIIGVPNKSITV